MCAKQQQQTITTVSGKLTVNLTVFIWCECECMCPLWVCVHVSASQWVYEYGYEWENVAYVCSSPQLFSAVFIWGGHALAQHTNTHPPLPELCDSLQRPGPVILTWTHIWIVLLFFLPCANTHTQQYTQTHTVIIVFQHQKWDSSRRTKNAKHILVSALSYWDIVWPHCTTDGRIGKGGHSVYHLSPPLSYPFSFPLLTNMYCMCGWLHQGLFSEGRQWRMWAMSDRETVLCFHPINTEWWRRPLLSG